MARFNQGRIFRKNATFTAGTSIASTKLGQVNFISVSSAKVNLPVSTKADEGDYIIVAANGVNVVKVISKSGESETTLATLNNSAMQFNRVPTSGSWVGLDLQGGDATSQNFFKSISADAGETVVADNPSDTANILGGTQVNTYSSGDTLRINVEKYGVKRDATGDIVFREATLLNNVDGLSHTLSAVGTTFPTGTTQSVELSPKRSNVSSVDNLGLRFGKISKIKGKVYINLTNTNISQSMTSINHVFNFNLKAILGKETDTNFTTNIISESFTVGINSSFGTLLPGKGTTVTETFSFERTGPSIDQLSRNITNGWALRDELTDMLCVGKGQRGGTTVPAVNQIVIKVTSQKAYNTLVQRSG